MLALRCAFYFFHENIENLAITYFSIAYIAVLLMFNVAVSVRYRIFNTLF